MNKRGVIIVPSLGEVYPRELSRETILHNPHGEDFKSEIKAMEEISEKRFDPGSIRKGLVILLGFDTLLNRFGPEKTLAIVEDVINYAKESGNTIIGTMKRGTRFLGYTTHTAESHFVFKDLTNALVIYGMRPKTGLYAVDIIKDDVRLVPIV
ncbi:MAG: hypothetical protein ACUVWK_04290 [Nitrososphaerales archaeon]